MRYTRYIIVAFITLASILNLEAQMSFSVPVYGFHLYSAEGINQGKGYEYGVSLQYRNVDVSATNYFVRFQFTWSPLDIYNEMLDTNISYVEKTISLGLGAVFIIDERNQDYAYAVLNVGKTTVSNSLFVGFSFIFEGIDLIPNSNKHKLQLELMPSIITGFGNKSAHAQFKVGVAYKF